MLDGLVANPLVFKDAFHFVLASPPPGGVRGRVWAVIILGQAMISARIQGGNLILIAILT